MNFFWISNSVHNITVSLRLQLIVIIFLLHLMHGHGQAYVIRDIKSFGAKGDGKTNDHAAFEKASKFFNARGGHGKLLITKGNYLVGKQTFSAGKKGRPAYLGLDVLHFKNVTKLEIEGNAGAKIKYVNGLRFGAFHPETGKLYEHGTNSFVNLDWAAFIGHCILLNNVQEVRISDIELDGNNGSVILGGVYGDVGRQLPHYGIFIRDCREVQIENVNVHHFALDGISIANKSSSREDDIKLLNSRFEYNSRQGLSWIGGNDLKVKNCQFNHTGQGRFYSAPGAGVDIEAEVGPIRNGKFEDCSFINNKGNGLVADTGESGFCSFKECTFWGTEAYAVWVAKPGFSFEDCAIYGSFVHGYDAATDKEATQFKDCHFEDKPYKGKVPYGNFLVESNGKKRLAFRECTFISNQKKLLWLEHSPNLKPEEKYQFVDCRFIINNTNLPQGDFVGVIRGIRYKNCTFEFRAKDARKKGYYVSDCCGQPNTDAGGNKMVYAE